MNDHALKIRSAVAWGFAGALALAGCARQEATPATTQAPAPAATAPADIAIPGTGIFPESITSAADGSVYVGSVGKAQIYRAAAGAATAEPFIAPGTGGLKQVFGVLVDEAAGTLWACSNQLGAGPPGAGPSEPGALFAFDLASGAFRASHVFPKGGMCNDIAVAPNGDVYVTDTPNMQVLRLAKGGAALEPWSPAGAFGPPGGVLDGIAIVGGRVIANTLATSKLFAVAIGADGKAGAVKELALDAALTRPDGMRAHGADGLLSTDGTGKIQHVVIQGDTASVRTVKEGLEGVVAVTVVGRTGYALEGQLGIMMAAPGGPPPPAEKPYRAVAFPLP